MNRQRLLQAAVWLVTLFCIAMMFAGPVGELSRRLSVPVDSFP
jgi:hypothetical protein